jgi:hypothetical protein
MIPNLVKERSDKYGEAWLTTGEIARDLDAVGRLPAFALFPWLIILNKLIRALTSPYHIDHWRDIAGYAYIVTEHLEKVQHDKVQG